MSGNQPLRGIRHHQLQLIVSGLRDGVILIEPDQTLTWANQAALRMRGAERIEDPGAAMSEYRARSDRGREVLGLVCQGLDDGAIAGSLGLARNTMRNHMASLYRRAHVRSLSALIVWARERGFFGREEGAERLHGPD